MTDRHDQGGRAIAHDQRPPAFAKPDARALPIGSVYITGRWASSEIVRRKGGDRKYVTVKVSLGYPGPRLSMKHEDLRYAVLGAGNILVLYADSRVYALLFIIPVDAGVEFWAEVETACAGWAADFWGAIQRALNGVVRGVEANIKEESKRFFRLPVRVDVLWALMWLQEYIRFEIWRDWALDVIASGDAEEAEAARDVVRVVDEMRAALSRRPSAPAKPSKMATAARAGGTA